MTIKKYKYYFKKPKSEIVKDLMKILAVAGVIIIAGQSPYFIRNIMREYKKWNKYPKRKIADTFSNLRRRGLIEINKVNNQIYINLTEEGRKKANVYQIGALEIKRPRKWDRKWRIVIFDIAQLKKVYREAFRGKLKELGFYCLQKSVWVHPFDCRAEIELLRDFFGLSQNELRFIVAVELGDEEVIRKFFSLG